MSQCLRTQPQWVDSNLNDTHPLMKGGPEEPYIYEAATQTYGVGDLVYVDSSGWIAICTLTGVRLNSAVAGIAVQAATNNASGAVANTYLRAIRKDDIFAMNVFHATPASAVTAQNLLGTVRGVRKDTLTQFGTSITAWGVDIENAVEGGADALARVKIIGFVQRGLIFEADGTVQTNKAVAIGDTYGLVLVQFLPWSAASDFNPFIRILQFDT